MNMHRVLTAILLLLAAASATAAEDIINVDDLPHTTLVLPNGARSTIIKYGEHNWREATASILTSNDETESDVCFEAKFEAMVPPDKLKLMGMLASLQVEDRIKFKQLSTDLKPGDNIWLAGELRKSRDGKTVVLKVIHVLKQLRDLDRYDQRIAFLEKKNDFEGLIDLGHRIEQQRTGNPTGFESFDKLGVLRNKAFETGLRLKEASLKRDDADGLFAVALQWKELLNRHSNFRALAEKCLKIDPDHPKAKRFAEELGLVLYENVWHHAEEVAKIKAQRKLDQERMDAAQKAAIEAKQKELEKAIASRPQLLNKYQAAIRVSDAKARASAIDELGEAVRKSPDAGFGREAVDILANLSEASAIDAGLAKAAQSDIADVRKDVYEALVWRGRQPGSTALDTMAASLKSEKDSTIARLGVDSLVSLGGKPAAATLIASLDTADRGVTEEIMEGLKLVTKQSLASREAWKDWWSKNKDSFNPQ